MNIVYQSDYYDTDRWISFDRYPRRIYRKFRSADSVITGQVKALKNTLLGLGICGRKYTLNPSLELIRSSVEPVILFGQSNVYWLVEKFPNVKFIVGPALYSHPIENPRLAEKSNVMTILVPGPWMKDMCEGYWGDKVVSWPVGIDTDCWLPSKKNEVEVDFLIYVKIMWGGKYSFLKKIRNILEKHSLTYDVIEYGHYDEESYFGKLNKCTAMIYLCEHETQGIAYQQALSTGTPTLAWDRNDYWLDPRFYPMRVKYKPVSSVPYWDDRCGLKFRQLSDFEGVLQCFLDDLSNNRYDPRSYILENFTLRSCANKFIDIYNKSACMEI